MKEKQDILLVYADEDNQPIEGLGQGWVTNFHKFLQNLLSQLQKDESQVTLVEATSLTADQVAQSGMILAVITTAFASQSTTCRLIQEWSAQKKSKGDLMQDGVSRFLKIRKNRFDLDEVFPEHSNLESYDLFYYDGLSGKTSEYTRFFGADTERGFWLKLIDIAYDIIHLMEPKSDDEVEKQEISRDKTIYLASTGLDLLSQRDIIKRELKRHGYEVLPSRSLPKEFEALEEMIISDLAKCRMSIHLIGEDYGYRPEGSDLSVVEIQNNLADEHTAQMSGYNKKHRNEKPFSRLIWLNPEVKNMMERQRIFVEDIKSKAALYDEAEVLQIQLQELKSIIKEELVTGGRISYKKYQQEGEGEDGSKEKQIYLITDKVDIAASKKLESFLVDQGFKVLLPAFEGEVAEIRTVHQENLRRCDGSIIYYGDVNSEWIKTKLSDLLKAPGMGRSKPLRAKAIYMPDEKSIDRDHFNKNKTLLLDDDGSLNPHHLAPFITQLKA
jgi:hypothetical protein